MIDTGTTASVQSKTNSVPPSDIKASRSDIDDRQERPLSLKEIAATKKYVSADDIDADLARYQSELDSMQAHRPWYQLLFSLSSVVVGYAGVWLWYYSHSRAVPWPLIIGVSLLLGIFSAGIMFAARQNRLFSLRTAIDILQVRKRNLVTSHSALLSNTGNQAPAGGYFDRLVDINVKNLGDYYVLVRLHNDKSFTVSVGAGVVGFLLIIAAIGFAFFSGTQKLPTAISAGSGVITEFIGAIFFYLYNRSVREMRDYFESLLTVQNILLSLKLVNDTADAKEKVKMVATLLSYLVGSKSPGTKSLLADLTDHKDKDSAGKNKAKGVSNKNAAKAATTGE